MEGELLGGGGGLELADRLDEVGVFVERQSDFVDGFEIVEVGDSHFGLSQGRTVERLRLADVIDGLLQPNDRV